MNVESTLLCVSASWGYKSVNAVIYAGEWCDWVGRQWHPALFALRFTQGSAFAGDQQNQLFIEGGNIGGREGERREMDRGSYVFDAVDEGPIDGGTLLLCVCVTLRVTEQSPHLAAHTHIYWVNSCFPEFLNPQVGWAV